MSCVVSWVPSSWSGHQPPTVAVVRGSSYPCRTDASCTEAYSKSWACRGKPRGNSGSVMILRFGPFVLDTARRQLRGDDGVRHLTPKAFELLTLLVREAPRVLTKQELHEQLWPDT